MSEFYPMPCFPTLAVADLRSSVGWYAALGFSNVFKIPGLVHLRWARYADLMLRAGTAGAAPRGQGVSLTFAVAAELDALAERARANGASLLREPGDRPWNARDFSIADPDGYQLIFTMGPLNRDLDIDQVVANVRRS